MGQRVHMARLGIALIAFVNGTTALAAPRTFLHGCAGHRPTIETLSRQALQVRVQRLPRVPRREPFEPGTCTAVAAGADA